MRSVNDTRFGVWVSGVSLLSDMAQADLDTLIHSNLQCEDLATSLPLLNHLPCGTVLDDKHLMTGDAEAGGRALLEDVNRQRAGAGQAHRLRWNLAMDRGERVPLQP